MPYYDIGINGFLSLSKTLILYISYDAEHFPPLPISTIFAPLEGERRKSTREIEGSIWIVYTEWVVHSWTLCFLSIMLYWSKTFVLINLSCTACSLLKHCYWWSTNTTILFLRGCLHRGSRYPFCLGAYNAVRTAQCMDALCSPYRTIFTKEHMPTKNFKKPSSQQTFPLPIYVDSYINFHPLRNLIWNIYLGPNNRWKNGAHTGTNN